MKVSILITFLLITLLNLINKNQAQRVLQEQTKVDDDEIINNKETVEMKEAELEEEERELKKLEEEVEQELDELKATGKISTISPMTVKEAKITPEMIVVNPVRRTGTKYSEANKSPCGGVLKSGADTLTNMGSTVNAIWEIRTPVALGNCTVSMSTGLDSNFTALKPIGDISYDSNYSFTCGRQKGFEFQQFELPKDYACDQCTLQVKWDTPIGDYYSCSDLMILGNKGKVFI